MELTLSNGLKKFWQWDTAQSITVPDNVPSVDFKINDETAVRVTVSNNTASVPDECFQSGEDLILWAYKTDHTIDAARVTVKPRTKPADYIYTPTETEMWHKLDARMRAMEANITNVETWAGQAQTAAATAQTAAEAAQAAAATLNISSGSWTPTLSGMSSYSYQRGRYLKIGDIAIVSFSIWGTMAGSNTEQIKVSGCPMVPAEGGYAGGGYLSGYYTANDTIFTTWNASEDGSFYAYGQTPGSGNKWGSSDIFQKTEGECGGGGTIMFKTNS